MVGEGLHMYQVQQLARDLGWRGDDKALSRSIAKEVVLDAMAEGKAVPKIQRRMDWRDLSTIAPPPTVPQKRQRKAPKKMDV